MNNYNRKTKNGEVNVARQVRHALILILVICCIAMGQYEFGVITAERAIANYKHSQATETIIHLPLPQYDGPYASLSIMDDAGHKLTCTAG